jgi:Na+-translocating ferredoxin:NAD+ oxidoreductase RnfG subunit
MIKRWSLLGCALLTVFFIQQTACLAFTLLSEEEALKEVFFSGAEIETETKTIAGDYKKRIEDRLGGSLVYQQEGSESAEVRGKNKATFYFAKKDGVRKGVAIIDVQPGKWGPVEFMVAMDINGTVKAVRVMSYQEIRGRPIARLAFMNQYRGKSVNSTLTVGKDITGISGATISSRSATFTVKKALVMYEEFYLKK